MQNYLICLLIANKSNYLNTITLEVAKLAITITHSDISRGHSPLGILSKVYLKSEWRPALNDSSVGIHRKSKEYNLFYICAKFCSFGRICPKIYPDVTLEDYNNKIIQTNVVLRTRIDASDFSPRIQFWAHHGFSKDVDWLAKMGPDGAHLNETGMKKFTCDIKTALKQCTYDLVKYVK